MNIVNLIPTQPDLRIILPTVLGNVDYQRLRQDFERIDQLLNQSDVEAQCLAQSVKTWRAARSDSASDPSPAEQAKLHDAGAILVPTVRPLSPHQ